MNRAKMKVMTSPSSVPKRLARTRTSGEDAEGGRARTEKGNVEDENEDEDDDEDEDER